ncbi:MAG: hypothetical protein ABSC24_08820 [Verrucomicrobiota bacterium]|jgi:hypothetical protein
MERKIFIIKIILHRLTLQSCATITGGQAPDVTVIIEFHGSVKTERVVAAGSGVVLGRHLPVTTIPKEINHNSINNEENGKNQIGSILSVDVKDTPFVVKNGF